MINRKGFCIDQFDVAAQNTIPRLSRPARFTKFSKINVNPSSKKASILLETLPTLYDLFSLPLSIMQHTEHQRMTSTIFIRHQEFVLNALLEKSTCDGVFYGSLLLLL